MRMTRPPMTVQLWRPNLHVKPPSVLMDVWDVIKFATLGGLLWVIVMLVMAS